MDVAGGPGGVVGINKIVPDPVAMTTYLVHRTK